MCLQTAGPRVKVVPQNSKARRCPVATIEHLESAAPQRRTRSASVLPPALPASGPSRGDRREPPPSRWHQVSSTSSEARFLLHLPLSPGPLGVREREPTPPADPVPEWTQYRGEQPSSKAPHNPPPSVKPTKAAVANLLSRYSTSSNRQNAHLAH